MSVTKRTTRGGTEYPICGGKTKLNIQGTYQVHSYLNIRYLGTKIKIN